jgi:alkanesulfonate monooxygenase SsuD/methylene tetrahydromethanopterin reductase-like flavin-dependent oxidoreductase (luciferase family)
LLIFQQMSIIGAMPADKLERIGVVVNRVTGVDSVISAASQAEALGYGTAWLTNGGPEDCVPLLAAIATRTTRLRLGTAVMQTYPRHPVVLATEANVIDELAPGRLRLGIGPSHDAVMAALGIRRVAPFEHLREYLQVIRDLCSGQPVDFEGEHYQVRSGLNRRADVPVLVGALQPKTFELADQAADGAVTWLCPAGYLSSVGLPAMERGASQSDRPRPPLVAHLAVCVHEDADEVRAAVRNGIPNIRFPSYQRGPLCDVGVAAERAGFTGIALTEHPVPGARWLASDGYGSNRQGVSFTTIHAANHTPCR